MCHKYDGFSSELFFDAFLKDVLPHMSVDGRQRIIQEVDVFIGVDGSGQADPLLLPPRQVQPPLPNLTAEPEESSHRDPTHARRLRKVQQEIETEPLKQRTAL